MSHVAGPLTFVLLVVFAGVPSLQAQSAVTGTTIDQATRGVIAGVRVSALDEQGRERAVATSDTIGRFDLQLPPGTYTIRAQRLGYQSADTRAFELADQVRLETLVQLSVQPVAVDPFVIVATRTMAGRLIDYYQRLDRAGVSGGRFITRAQIDSVDMPGITAHMEHSGVPMQVNRRGEKWPTGTGRCRMRVFLDDVPIEGFVIDELVRPDNVEGVEIYRSAYEAPPRYSDRMNTCGVILIWTRMDKAGTLTFWRGLLVAGVGLTTAALLRLFWTK